MHKMSKLKVLFRTALEKYPIVGNAIVYGTLCVTAETSQQVISKKLLVSAIVLFSALDFVKEENPKPLDTAIIGRYAIYGTTIAGPLLAGWYRFLDKKLPGCVTKTVIKKMLIDQFIMTPQLLVIFYITMSVLERKQDLLEECRNKFVNTYLANCLFWMPAQAVNFSLVPSVYRVTYIGTCSFAWVSILCWFKRQKITPKPDLEVVDCQTDDS